MKPIVSTNGVPVSTLSRAGREAGIPNNGCRHDAAFGRPLRRVLRGAIARTRLTDDMLIIRAMETLDAQADRDAI
jgi:hypothetical protein